MIHLFFSLFMVKETVSNKNIQFVKVSFVVAYPGPLVLIKQRPGGLRPKGSAGTALVCYTLVTLPTADYCASWDILR